VEELKVKKVGVGLLLAVHFDAARGTPVAWLTALWWRLLGKKVRARAQLAPLLGNSRHAYRLWLRNEESPQEEPWGEQPGAGPTIVALVAQEPGFEATLSSLHGHGVTAWVIGAPGLETPADVAARIDWSAAPWLLPLAAGDVVAPGAAAAYRAAVQMAEVEQAKVGIIYADDDLIDARGRRTSVHFKPAWNAELSRHFDYLTGACILRSGADALAAAHGPDWAAQLVNGRIAAIGKGEEAPLRIARVLHHRRSRPTPKVPARPAGLDQRAVPLPKVTVIVPTRNRLDLLSTCIDGLARTEYPDLEVVVVDNGSDDPATLDYLAALDPARHRVLRDTGPFNFSALNNRAARQARGDLLCLLNNDIEVLTPDWLAIMAQQALRPEVGAVGARLLYPNGRIQHAGVVLGICGGAAHAHRMLRPDCEGYFRRHALPQFVSAVTAACLVVRRESFEAVGGLDEENFAVAFNDVDLCLRLNERGWQSLYEPRATLVHHESVSRGLDRDPVGAARFAGELAALKARWGTGDMDSQVDPFHHPHLSRYSERFVLRL
jgi:GT2 family glycosyltransferase